MKFSILFFMFSILSKINLGLISLLKIALAKYCKLAKFISFNKANIILLYFNASGIEALIHFIFLSNSSSVILIFS